MPPLSPISSTAFLATCDSIRIACEGIAMAQARSDAGFNLAALLAFSGATCALQASILPTLSAVTELQQRGFVKLGGVIHELDVRKNGESEPTTYYTQRSIWVLFGIGLLSSVLLALNSMRPDWVSSLAAFAIPLGWGAAAVAIAFAWLGVNRWHKICPIVERAKFMSAGCRYDGNGGSRQVASTPQDTPSN